MRRATLLFVIMLLLHNVCLAASVDWGYETISEEEKAAVLEQLNLQLLPDDSRKTSLRCFDVGLDGAVAIGTASGSGCILYVYDSSGAFRYGYSFHADGAYGLEFRGDMLALFLLRGNVFVLFDSEGNCVDFQKITNVEQNHVKAKELLNRSTKIIGEKTYSLQRDMDIGDSYSRLVLKEKSGECTVLYDVTSQNKTGQIIMVAFIACFFGFVIWGCIEKKKSVSGGRK